MTLLKKRGVCVHACYSSSHAWSFNTRPSASPVIISLYCHIAHCLYLIVGNNTPISVAARGRRGSRYLHVRVAEISTEYQVEVCGR
jgi:hypothetical protein